MYVCLLLFNPNYEYDIVLTMTQTTMEVNTGSGQTRQNLQIHFRKLRTADLQQAEADVAERWGTEALLYSCRKNFTNQAAKTDHTHM